MMEVLLNEKYRADVMKRLTVIEKIEVETGNGVVI